MKILLWILAVATISINTYAQNKNVLNLFFDVNSSQIRSEELQKLNQLIQESKENLINILAINSYTDTTGSVQNNKKLSLNRLQSVETVLKKNNIIVEIKKSNAENYFDSKSKFDSDDLAKWRRVDIIYTITESLKEENVKLIEPKNPDSKFNEDNITESIVLDVQFYGGTADPFPNALTEIKTLADFLKTHTNLKMLVRGHVCCMDDYNLSVKRAQMVYNTLIELGVETNRLDFQGYSNTMPIAYPETTEYDKQRNRRVDVVFTKMN